MSLFGIFGRGKKGAFLVKVGELGAWLNDKKRREFQDACSQATRIRSRVMEICSEISGRAEDLSGDEVKVDELTQPFIPTITVAKDNLAKKVKNITSGLTLPEVKGFEDIVLCRNLVQQTLIKLREAGETHGKYVSRFFNRKVKGLQERFKDLAKEALRLQTIFNRHSARAETGTEACAEAQRLVQLIEDVEQGRTMAEGLKAEIRSLETVISEINLRIKQMEGTLGPSKLSEREGEVKQLEEESASMEAELSAKILRIARPLRKYTHEAALDRSKRRLIHDYLTTPLQSLLSDKTILINDILAELKKHIENGQLELKDPNKALRNTEELLTYIPVFLTGYAAVIRSAEGKRNIIDEATSREIDDLRRHLTQLEKTREDKARSIREFNRQTEESEKLVLGKATRIEEMVEEAFGEKIKIQLPMGIRVT